MTPYPHRDALPPGTSEDLRAIDEMLARLVEDEPVPAGLRARIFFASAPGLWKPRAPMRRQVRAAAWLAIAASLAAAFAVVFFRGPSEPAVERVWGELFVDAAALEEPAGSIEIEQDLADLTTALELWDLTIADLTVRRVRDVVSIGSVEGVGQEM